MIYYIGYYATMPNKQNRRIYLSANNKMEYIINTLSSLDYKIEVVSCALTKNKCFYKSYVENITDNVSIKYLKTFGTKNFITKIIDKFQWKISFFLYLLRKIKKDDTLIVYHATSYPKIIRIIKKLKRCKVILELEEIYSDVKENKKLRKQEFKLFDKCDAFIYPTPLLSQESNKFNKPYIVIHGSYTINQVRETLFKDNKIHVVYAGTLENRKGASSAVLAAKFLPSNYHMHILGFGSDDDIHSLIELIAQTSKESACTITFEGVKSGTAYTKFIQSCQIGLCTQNPDASFNGTSFPSKILSYMSNGLRVVSIRIPAIELSDVSNHITFYDCQQPEEISKAILKININDNYDSRLTITKLGEKFKKDLKEIIESKTL